MKSHKFLLLVLSIGILYSRGSYALSVNQELFVAISKCDLGRIEKTLIDGADTESVFDTGNETALAYAIATPCVDQIKQMATPEEMIFYTTTQVKKIITLLMKYGARTDHMLDHYQGFKYPVLLHPFFTDIGGVVGGDYFEQMVINGASPHLLDSRGNNALALMGELDFDKKKKVINTGVSYMQRREDGTTLVHLFPSIHYPEEYMKSWMEKLKEQGFDYNTGSYLNEYDHPILSNFSCLNGCWWNDFANFKNKLKTFKDTMIPFMRPAWNIPSGPKEVPVLVNMMKVACPTTEYEEMRSFSFSPNYYRTSSFRNDAAQNQQFLETYKLLRELIQTEEIDLLAKDKEGRDILSYAIHLCPFEVVQDILKKEDNAFTQSHLSKILSYTDDNEKSLGISTIFNNDDRTLKYLIDKGLSIKGTDLSSLGYRNPLTRYVEKIPWRDLEGTGLNRSSTTAIEVVTNHLFKKYTDTKETKFSLKNLKGENTFKFTGLPLEINIASQTSNHIRGLRVFDTSKEFTYFVKDNVLHFRFKGGFEYSGQAHIKEIDPNGEATIIFKETKSFKQSSELIQFKDILELKRGQKNNIGRANDNIIYTMGSTYRYVGPDSINSCRMKICDFLKFEKAGPDALISINENQLREKDPALYVVWNYLNTPIQEREGLIKSLASSATPQTLSYFLDLLDSSVQNSWQEKEVIGILDLLINLEVTGKLPYQINPLKEKLSHISGMSVDGSAFLGIRNYVLTGHDPEAALALATGSYHNLEEFIQWYRSLSFTGEYHSRVNKLRMNISKDLDGILGKLKATDEQKRIIKGLI